ncbi:MAG: serine/threonine protein phosphatase [Proteobacteria bacterium]|nr:serine/threonine protein phosphatase [Pseudomonadota bacterium]
MSAPGFWARAGASALTCATFVFVYNGCNYLASLRPHVGSCYFWFERYWPFVPALIVPYWSLDLFFAAAPFFLGSRDELRQHVRRIITAIAIAGFFFLTFPLTMAWPRPEVTGPLGALFGALNNFHNFYNCAPSLHIALRTILWPVYVSPLRGAPRAAIGGWFALIGISTLLCWQHYLIDVITGQILGLFCLHLYPFDAPPRPEVDTARGINADLRLARRYGAVALVLLFVAVVGWPAGALLLWPVAALLIVAAAYAGGGPALLDKSHGTFPRSSLALLAPYRWLAELSFRWFERSLPASVSLHDGVSIGRRWSPSWRGDEMAAVLDLTAEYVEHEAWRARHYLNIPVLDLTSPSPDQLRDATEFIAQAPRPVYVHCSLGLGRSACVAAAWLLRSRQAATVDEALEKVARVQPHLRLARGTRGALENFAGTLEPGEAAKVAAASS